MGWLVLIALLLPLLSLATLARERWACAALCVAPLPLLALGILGAGRLVLPQMLLGSVFAVDEVNRPLLLLAGLGWALAGMYAVSAVKERLRSFAAGWLLTLTGQAMLLLSQELASFYLGFVTVTLAAYALVVHAGSEEAMRAGRVYIVLAFIGESLALSGLLTLGASYGNVAFVELPRESLGVAPLLMLIGFAVKLGIVPLHMWLPLAHPVAPVPASAVLSGVIVKAGLLGMLRFVPPGSLPMTELLIGAGLFTAFYAALVGLAQRPVKTVLAYSTVSQMGLALAGLSAVLAVPANANAQAALSLFVLHHGLNKVALFLGAGHALERRLPRALFLLSAACIAGLPLTSGMLAKDALKHAIGPGWWLLGLSASSILTTALLLHAFAMGCCQGKGPKRVHPAWLLAAVTGLLVPWLWAWHSPGFGLTLGAAWSAFWPVALGTGAYLIGRHVLAGRTPSIPEGDIASPLEGLAHRAGNRLRRASRIWSDWEPQLPRFAPRLTSLRDPEIWLRGIPFAGMCMLIVVLALWLLL